MQLNDKTLERILVLGGGAAGWLTASILAAEHGKTSGGHCQIVLIEAPDIPTVGVGEGTWPSMRETLRRIGLDEQRLFSDCDAAFKQGSLFCGWASGDNADRYYHPFSMPQGYFELDLGQHVEGQPYAYAVSPQPAVCDRALAPKQLATPDYAGVLNYAYHFDAVKFGACLREHATGHLAVEYHRATITEVRADAQGNIASLHSDDGRAFHADLFVDCSGQAARLIGQHYQVPWQDKQSILFNNRALAAQLPYAEPDAPIASVTCATARANGWIWDIGLPARRGLGYVYADEFVSAAEAEADFRQHLAGLCGHAAARELAIRSLQFQPGFRQIFWTRNCVAVGMAAGFIEPLEASALALIEQSAALIRDFLPVTCDAMALAASRYNQRMRGHWDHIIAFLKLHYVLSKRDDSAYWRAHRESGSVPDNLRDNLQIWRHRAPNQRDFEQAQLLFPAASYRFVLHGMGFECDYRRSAVADRNSARAHQLMAGCHQQTASFLAGLPANRQLLAALTKRAEGVA